jgi:hypothetical protein
MKDSGQDDFGAEEPESSRRNSLVLILSEFKKGTWTRTFSYLSPSTRVRNKTRTHGRRFRRRPQPKANADCDGGPETR